MSLRSYFHVLSLLPSFLALGPMQTIKSRVQNAKQFYREVRTEMMHVTWPDRREVAGTTVIVIVVILVFGIYLSIADELSLRTIAWILKRFGATR
jgi:preprotein translocase SecE subunit